MRVITGIAKGKKLIAPRGNKVRPTTDRIKESLFNIVNPIIEGSVFIDCFAGTGSIGIEALSRGADKVYFIENSKSSIEIIKKNLEITKLHDKGTIVPLSVDRGLKFLCKENVTADIFFMDPPYSLDIIASVVKNISQFDLLSENGIIIAEHDNSFTLDHDISGFYIYDSRNYGNTVMTYFKRR